MDIPEMTAHAQKIKSPQVVFEELYETVFPAVARFVSKMNGTFQDAKDIFHDAMVIYYEKYTNERVAINTSPEAYVVGIAKHLWLRKFKQDYRKVSLDDVESAIAIPEDYFPSYDSRRLMKFLEHAGKRCLDLLRAFYYEKLSMKDIKNVLGFQNEHSATVQKYKCLEKVRSVIKANAVSYEDFME